MLMILKGNAMNYKKEDFETVLPNYPDNDILLTDTPFGWCFNDPKVSDDDLKQIKPLTKESSSNNWNRLISEKHRHLALYRTAEQTWLNALERLDYNWEDDWNKNDMKSFAVFLSSKLNIPEDEPVWFFWMKESGVKTKWGVFLRNWINFLYEDEAPVLYVEGKNTAILFRPGGMVFAGKKDEI